MENNEKVTIPKWMLYLSCITLIIYGLYVFITSFIDLGSMNESPAFGIGYTIGVLIAFTLLYLIPSIVIIQTIGEKK